MDFGPWKQGGEAAQRSVNIHPLFLAIFTPNIRQDELLPDLTAIRDAGASLLQRPPEAL